MARHNLHHVAPEAPVLRRFDERRLLVVLRDGTEVVASRSASERVRGLVR